MATTNQNAATASPAKPGDKHEKYFYFVDGEKFDSESEFTTGAIIKSRLAEAKRSMTPALTWERNKARSGFIPFRPPALASNDSC